ncbi:MAG: helix-turn-helix domain-containing protein [Bacteroidota bacterium]
MQKIKEVSYKKKFRENLELEIIPLKSLKKVFKETKDHDPFQPHRLKFNALLVITKGKSGKHSIDFKDYAYESHSVILIAKDQIHHFIDIPSNNQGYLIMFTENLFLDIGVNYPFIISHFYNNQLYYPVHHLTEKQFDSLHALILKIIEKINSKKKSVRVEIVQAYFKILLLEIFACREYKSKKIKRSTLIEDFIEFQMLLKENLVQEKNVKFYAKKMSISQKKLNLITQSIVNRTAKDYILSFIALEAKKLLVSSDSLFKEVAYELGFDEPTNFTKFFKAQTGMLPSEFIKMYNSAS